MTAVRPLDQLVSDWLRSDAPPHAPAELLDATLHRVSTVAQHRGPIVELPWLRRRGRLEPRTTDWPSLRLALAIAAVVIVAIAIAGLLRGRETVGPDQSPSPSPPGELTMLLGPGSLVAGRYVVEPTFDVPLTIHLELPDGWQQSGWAIQKSGIESFVSFWTVEQTYVDPCHWSTTAVEPQLGRSVDELVAGLRGQIGRAISEPTPVTIDGHAGQRLVLDVPAGIGLEACDQGEYRNWVAPGAGDGSRWVPVQAGYAGYTDTVWILDVDGLRLVIDVTESPGISAEVRAEVRAIVASITFDDLRAGVRFGPCSLDVTTTIKTVEPSSPNPSTTARPAVTVRAIGSGWGPDGPGRAEVSLLRPDGRLEYPGVSNSAGAIETGFELDEPGIWRLRVMAWGVGCLVDVPIEVLPINSG